MDTLAGRVAVVTGAASGIGRGLSELLLEQGASVVLADVEEAALAAAAADLSAVGPVLAVATDVADAASVQALADAAVARFGAVHVICNNAGVSGLVGRSWATPIEDWAWVLGVNVLGVVHGIRSFLPILLEQGAGHVVNTGSAAACFSTVPGMAPYGASKHAVLGISEALRLELLAAGAAVGVTVLVPGDVVNTPIMSSPRNWPERLGVPQEPDADPVSTVVRMMFTQAMATGVEPRRCAAAAIEGILADRFLVCDDPDQLAGWGRHPADLAAGQQPVWPPA